MGREERRREGERDHVTISRENEREREKERREGKRGEREKEERGKERREEKKEIGREGESICLFVSSGESHPQLRSILRWHTRVRSHQLR